MCLQTYKKKIDIDNSSFSIQISFECVRAHNMFILFYVLAYRRLAKQNKKKKKKTASEVCENIISTLQC